MCVCVYDLEKKESGTQVRVCLDVLNLKKGEIYERVCECNSEFSLLEMLADVQQRAEISEDREQLVLLFCFSK